MELEHKKSVFLNEQSHLTGKVQLLETELDNLMARYVPKHGDKID